MKSVKIFSNSNKVELTFSTWELLFIVTSLIKVIRLDKGNIKFNYRVYKIIDKIALTLNKNITIPGAVFKSQIKQATKVLITDNLITFMNEEIFLSSVHYQQIEGTYPNIEQLIPDSFTNNFEKEFSFNCDYIGQFCNQVKKLSLNKAITFNGSDSDKPFVISAKCDIKNPFETLEGFNPILNYLIMPILKRD